MNLFTRRESPELTARRRELLDRIAESERRSAYLQGFRDGMTVDVARLINGEEIKILGTPVAASATWEPPASDRAYFDAETERAISRHRAALFPDA